MLYLFDQDDNFLNILSKDEGLVDTWFKDYQNHLIDEPFVFNVESNSPLLQHIVEENQAAFYDRDGDLRLVRMKELYEETTQGRNNIRVKCEPSFLELYDHFIEDKRITNGTAQTALNRALEGSRFIGEVTVDLGLATDNFYWISGIEAVFKILGTWGGALKDTIVLDDDNEIIERKLWIVQRLGTDNGLIVEPDYNAEQISRKTLSYVETALWGQGSSLETDGGGYTRYITFEDVVWSKSNGDPVDKPKGQKWVGDPQALSEHGYLHNGVRKHKFGHYSNQEYETPEELLWATWNELQKRKLKEIIHEATIYESEKKVSLGDTVTILDRNYNKPIELQSQITGLEYDILLPDEEIKIVVGKYIDMNEDPLQKDVDDLKEVVKKPRPTAPINNDSYPDIKPGTPINVNATGAFQTIQLFWDYDSSVYISHYEVYGSQVSDFVPDEQQLMYRGQSSAFSHEIDTGQTWYYYVRAVNTRGTVGEFSYRVSASSIRVITDDILFGSITAELLANNLDLANKLSEGTLDWINQEPLYQIQQTENRILSDVSTRIGDVLNDISLINTDLGNLHYQDAIINNRIDGITTTVQETVGVVDNLTGQVDHLSTDISMINQRADGIEQSVTSVQGDLNNAWTEIGLIDLESDRLSLSISSVRADLDGLEIGGRNLANKEVLYFYSGTAREGDSFRITTSGTSGIRIREEVFEVNRDYVVSFKIKKVSGDIARIAGHAFAHTITKGVFIDGEKVSDTWGNTVVPYPNDTDVHEIEVYFRYTNPDYSQSKEFMIQPNRPGYGLSYEAIIWDLQLEKGNKATDWSPAPEDMADKAGLISYINLSTEGIRIHGQRVHISGQTLIDNAVIGTAAIANGAVTNLKIGTGAVDTLQVKDGAITNAKIYSLNADKINAGAIRGIDIYGSRFRSSSGTDWMEIVGGNMHLDQANGRYVNVNPDGLFGYNASGSLRFQANSTLVTSAAHGTSTANVYLAAQSGYEARVVDMAGIPGSGGVNDYSYLALRASGFYGNFWNINTGHTPDGLPVSNIYARPLSDGELRVTLNGSTTIYQPIRAESVKANVFEVNSLSGSSNHLYIRSRTAGEIRTTVSGTIDTYVPVRASLLFANALDVNTGTHLYARPLSTGELRVTMSGSTSEYRPVRAEGVITGFTNLYLQGSEIRAVSSGRSTWGSNQTYAPMRASSFPTGTSLRENKTDIEAFAESVLDALRNVTPYLYRIKGDEGNPYKQLGLMVDETPRYLHGEAGDSMEMYALNTFAIKGLKELDTKVINIEDRLDVKDLEIQYLKQKIKLLEDKVA